MEQVRLIIAILLSLLVFLLWDLLFVDKQPVKSPKQPGKTAEQPQAPDSPGQTDSRRDRQSEKMAAEKAPAEKPSVPAQTFNTITVDTDLYTAEISEKGAAVKRFALKEYRTGPQSDAPRQTLVDADNPVGSAVVELPGLSDSLADAVFTTDFERQRVQVNRSPQALSFYWESEEGVVLEKRYVFYPDRYQIDLSVNLVNHSPQTLDTPLAVEIINPPPGESRTFSFQGPFVFIDGQLEEIDVGDVAEKPRYEGSVKWAGIEDRYFMTALVPEKPENTRINLSLDSDRNLLHVKYRQPTEPLSPGVEQEYAYSLFFGPKQMSILKDFGHGLEDAVDFGFFDIIAKPCLWLMNAIRNNVVANYGIAIILLTLIFKIIFWPLGNKSYRSMAEMKKLQPLMADIRKKYKDDKKKMNEEVMQLYRTYKVNPLSGCLPMVVQIPVFIAFYRMLYEAIELRHAPFMLWINDLSSPDRLFRFDVTIPFMAPPYGIPVLTIVMGATMFLQQKLSPPPGDPSQAKFMMMMPLIFTVIFINFPSGLVLYWLVNNVVSIGQQYYITRKVVGGV
ncbi:MAG: membrane protein insertase YidC [Thermodesulfobacteriota bacterium]